jgi:DNA-binding response OmpR family regulator
VRWDNLKAKVLLVEDDPHIRKFIQLELEHEGYEVKTAVTGPQALDELEKELPDVVLLDVMLPEMNGFTVLERIREDFSTELPVIMLTARGELEDRVRGLKSGADDYIVKPFHIEELLARLEAVLRRKGYSEKILYGNIEMNLSSREVKVNGEPVELSRTEFDLLKVLLTNAGIVMSKDRLLELVWGTEEWGNPNVVEVYINYLRKKLGSAGKIIKTVRGVGYVAKE